MEKLKQNPLPTQYFLLIYYPIINITHQDGTFFFFYQGWNYTDTYNHPKFKIYPRIHFWCCTLYRFEQMHNDIYPSLFYTEFIFSALKIVCAPPIHPSHCPSPGNEWVFYCLHGFAFSRMPYRVEITSYIVFAYWLLLLN